MSYTAGAANTAMLRATVTRYLPQVSSAVADVAQGIDALVDVGAEKFVASTGDRLIQALRASGIEPAED